MSSLHQDRLLGEGSEPGIGTSATLPTAQGTSRRVVAPTEEKATTTVSTQRLGRAQRTGTTNSAAPVGITPQTTRAAGARAVVIGALASRARVATVKAASAKAATTKAATVKAASAKAATAKAATAARAAAVSTVANHAAGVRSARAAAAMTSTPTAKATLVAKVGAATQAAPAGKTAAGQKAPARNPVAVTAATQAAPTTPTAAPVEESAAAKAAPQGVAGQEFAARGEAAPAGRRPTTGPTPATATSTDAAPQVRPTPHKRVPEMQAPPSEVPPVALGTATAADVDIVRVAVPADGASAGTGRRRTSFLHRRLPAGRRRPALYLTAAIVGAVSLSAFTAQDAPATATATASQSVSVAEQLGIDAAESDALVDPTAATDRLGELAASRNTREAEQAAAMHAQTEADRIAAEAAAAAAAAAAEAARPDAVLPVQGARLTSGFGARWGTLHAGIDLAAPMHTPEYAVMDGVVLEAGPASGFGLAVYVQHHSGDVTVYGHMDEILVEAGQVVRAGDTIALLGNRGQSTGPHLHFEVHAGGLDGTKVDPLPWLRAAGVDI